MTNGYSGYNELMRTDGIEQLICWAQVRRRFVEAVKVQPRGKRGLADEAVAMIGELYGVERDYKDASDDVCLLALQTHSVPALAALRTWLDKVLPGVTQKSALGTALPYLRDYWPRLTSYTEHGDLPIDNNRAENAIRPSVVGRKGMAVQRHGGQREQQRSHSLSAGDGQGKRRRTLHLAAAHAV